MRAQENINYGLEPLLALPHLIHFFLYALRQIVVLCFEPHVGLTFFFPVSMHTIVVLNSFYSWVGIEKDFLIVALAQFAKSENLMTSFELFIAPIKKRLNLVMNENEIKTFESRLLELIHHGRQLIGLQAKVNMPKY